MKSPIQSLDASYLVHMTEDPDRISSAVAKLLSTEAPPLVERLEGHFGNAILRASFHLEGSDAWHSLRSVLSMMEPRLATETAARVESFIDEHSAMFLRFDKQALVTGSLRLASGDPVRVKVKPRGHIMKEEAPAFFRNLLRGG